MAISFNAFFFLAYISLRFFSLLYAQIRKYILNIVSERGKCDVLDGTSCAFLHKGNYCLYVIAAFF